MWGIFLFLSHVGLRDQSQIIRFGLRGLFPLKYHCSLHSTCNLFILLLLLFFYLRGSFPPQKKMAWNSPQNPYWPEPYTSSAPQVSRCGTPSSFRVPIIVHALLFSQEMPEEIICIKISAVKGHREFCLTGINELQLSKYFFLFKIYFIQCQGSDSELCLCYVTIQQAEATSPGLLF